MFEKNSSHSHNDTLIKATTEEKHWLNTCIKQDKFITFEEAMKTFIPEYVECIKSNTNTFTINKIYKIKEFFNNTNKFIVITDDLCSIRCPFIGGLWLFKSSTKEAYDAQFVVKEPEFVLPELWHIIITPENYKILSKYFLNKLPHAILYTKGIMGIYRENRLGHTQGNIKGSDYDFGNEITLEQFKKYVLKEEIVVEEVKVIELLPQFKVIETIETITKVENNEGNQFFIGDTITPTEGFNKGNKFVISEFRYNNAKTNICAITNTHSPNGIGIDKIEHYIEPKIEKIVNETLLEKAKRLYPIGTKVNSLGGCENQIIDNNTPFISCKDSVRFTMKCLVYLDGKWADIIK